MTSHATPIAQIPHSVRVAANVGFRVRITVKAEITVAIGVSRVALLLGGVWGYSRGWGSVSW